MPAHTPGPWRIEQWLDDARLIAAAPAMYEALFTLLAEADDPPHDHNGCTCPPCMARAALAAADGTETDDRPR